MAKHAIKSTRQKLNRYIIDISRHYKIILIEDTF
jgi:hypothetical protein